jgi:tRNA-uridine 2-sulfurtransferase
VNKKRQKVYPAKARVFVGVSGGVDSSVVAYLLKKEGYDVHGIFVKTWSPEWLPCTWVAEKRDAMRVCASLDIPFHFLDAEEEYKKGVADYMIAEYRAGRTPNPDVLCNRVVKFGAMWNYAKSHGAEYLATGHYARTDGEVLMKGIDGAKDQSYFLWMLQKDELKNILLPIGKYKKDQVRKIAKSAGLFTDEKKDSQGICFLGDVDMREFLSHYIEQKRGDVVDTEGKVIGEHDGVWFYTLGERHGFTINNKEVDSKPHYVVGKNIEKNQLIVSTNPRTTIGESKHKISLRESNWLINPEENKKYTCQIRYHGELIPCEVKNDDMYMTYDGVIPLGQSLVVYENDMLVGGGIIEKTEV